MGCLLAVVPLRESLPQHDVAVAYEGGWRSTVALDEGIRRAYADFLALAKS